ncbi:MAG: GNAT family N-acetyltransferase [Casimicrobiaceae bacterium]
MDNVAEPTTRAMPRSTTGLGAASPGAMAGFDPAMHWHETLRDGAQVLIRPIHKDDAGMERAFIERLSPESREYRFLGHVAISDELIRQMTDVDNEHDMAFVALRQDAGTKLEVGVARFYIAKDGASCECAVTVSDEWQHKGLGKLLMRHLIEVARQRGIRRMVSVDNAGNAAMHNLATSLGFQRKRDDQYPGEVVHTLDL